MVKGSRKSGQAGGKTGQDSRRNLKGSHSHPVAPNPDKTDTSTADELPIDTTPLP